MNVSKFLVTITPTHTLFGTGPTVPTPLSVVLFSAVSGSFFTFFQAFHACKKVKTGLGDVPNPSVHDDDDEKG